MPEPDAPAKQAPRRKRYLLWGGGALLLLLGLPVLLLPTILSSGWVRGIAEEKASEAAGRAVSMGSLDVGWSVTTLRDLRLGAGPGDPISGSVAEIRVPAGITMAFASRYDAGEIEVDRPEIRIDLRARPKPPAEHPSKPEGSGGGGGPSSPSPVPPFSVKVKVRGGTLVLVDLEGKERRLGGFTADLTAASDGPAEVSFALDAGPGGRATLKAKASPFRDGRPVAVEALEAVVEAAVESLDLDLGFAGLKGIASGSLSVRAAGDGTAEDGKAVLDVRGFAMEGIDEPEIHAEGGFRRGKDGSVELRDGLLRLKGLEARASASLSPSGALAGAVSAKAALDLVCARAKRFGVPFDGFFQGEFVLEARASSDGKADRFTGNATVRDGQVGFGTKHPPIDEPVVRADFDLVREGPKWTVASLSMKSATADLSLSGTALQDLTAADLRARAAVRLGPALRIAKAFGVPLPGEVSGDLALDASLRRSGQAGDEAKGTLVVTDLSVLPPGEGAKPVREPRLAAEFEAVPGKEDLEVKGFTWTGAGAVVRIAGKARADGSAGAFPRFDADLDLEKAAALAGAFGFPLPVRTAGAAEWRGTVSWKDTFATVDGAGDLLVRDLVLGLPGERTLREPEVRARVDAGATRGKDGYGIRIGAATLAAKGIDAAASGTASPDGSLDLSLRGAVSLPDALRRAAELGLLAKDPLTRGSVAFDLAVKGRPGDLRAEIRTLDAKDAEFDLRAAGAVAEKGAGALAFEAGGDLAVLLDLAARAGAMEPVKGAAGKAALRGTVKAAGADAPLRLEFTAGVEGLRYPDPAGGAPWTQKGIGAEVAADLDRATLAAAGTARLTADDGWIALTGTVDRARADLKADLDFDAGGFCRSRPDLLPLPDMTVGRAKGKGWLKAPLDGPFDPAKVDGGASLVLDSVKTEPVELKEAAVDLFLRAGTIEARNVSATVNGGKVAGSAGVGFAGEEPKHFLDLKGDGIRIDPAMNYVLRQAVPLFVVGDGGGVAGTLGFSVRLDASGTEWLPVKKSMVGKGSLSVADGSVSGSGMLGEVLELLDGGRGLSFSSVTAEFSVHDRRVWTERMLVDGSEHALVFTGSTAFNGDLDYRIGAKGLRLGKKAMERIQPLLDKDGNLPFTLTGNVAKPRVRGPDLKKKLKGLLGGKDD